MEMHILDSDLDLIYTEIMAATNPEDVFGSPATNLPLFEQQSALKERYARLKKVTDPKQYTRVVDANAAADARETLAQLYAAAKAALNGGDSVLKFTVRDVTYHIGERIAKGEHSVIHRGIATRNAISDEVAIKIAVSESAGAMLRKEAEYLRSFAHAHERSPIIRVRRTLPTLIETFSVEGRTVNVLPYFHGHRNVREIVRVCNHELPVGHGAWIARRVLALPLTANMAGLQHNAITPEHVLVHPITHEPVYTGWAHATPHTGGNSVSDIRMTGNCLWYLFGNPEKRTWNTDVPKTFVTMIESMVADNDADLPHDLPKFFTDFTDAVYAALGKRYRPLNL